MTIEDILNSLAGRGYADGSTWMQQPQTQPDGPPMPAGNPMQLAGAVQNMPRHRVPNRLPPQALANANPNAPFPQMLPPMNVGNPSANAGASSAPQQPSGMIGWRARMQPSLADLAPNARQMGGNMVMASNGFQPFNGRY